jgi:glycosyltransferase involved in cell wall biosynthesis
MRVLIASSNLGSNGASIFARRSLMQLHKAGYEVMLACEEGAWVGHDLPPGMPVIRTNFHRWPFDECDRVAAWSRERGVSLVHSHLTRSCNFGALLRLRHGFKSIAHLHANHPQIHTGFHDLLLAVSDDVARRHRVLPWNWTAEVVTLTNFVDDEEFHPLRDDQPDLLRTLLGVPPSTPVLLSVGAICRRKGQDQAVRAFAEVRKKHPDALLALVGAGELPRGLPMDGVRLLGYRRDVPLLIPSASMVIVPSRQEPFSLAAVEAMACEVPVVAFSVGGLAEVISGGAGISVRPGDCSAMADALSGLLSDEAYRRRQAASGRLIALNRFGKEAHLDALVGHYRRVLAQ